jgi:hypothetical protein
MLYLLLSITALFREPKAREDLQLDYVILPKRDIGFDLLHSVLKMVVLSTPELFASNNKLHRRDFSTIFSTFRVVK